MTAMQLDVTEWFFETAEEVFGFLREVHGFEVAMKHRHHEGNAIVFANAEFKFSIQCAPDWDSIAADLVIPGPRSRVILSMSQVGQAVGKPHGMTYGGSWGPPVTLSMAGQMERWREVLADYLSKDTSSES